MKGTGSHEHSWTPNAIRKLFIGGWDWFSLTLENGWTIYAANYLPSPQAISGAVAALDPFGTLLISSDGGETITELKDVNLKITQKDALVYKITKVLAENVDRLGDVVKDMKGVTIKDLALDIGVPFHPGALKYYKEKGVIK